MTPKAPDVEEFPYLFKNRSGAPTYCKSYNEAVKLMQTQLMGLRQQFMKFDSDVVRRCDEAYYLVGELGPDGGTVDVVISEYADLRYQATLAKRESVL